MSYEEDGQYSQDMVCARYSASESRAKIPFCSKTLPTQSVVCVHWGPLLGLFGPAVSDIASRRERKIVGPALGLHGYSSKRTENQGMHNCPKFCLRTPQIRNLGGSITPDAQNTVDSCARSASPVEGGAGY